MLRPIDRSHTVSPGEQPPPESSQVKQYPKEYASSLSGKSSFEKIQIKAKEWFYIAWDAIKYYILFCWFDSNEDKRNNDLALLKKAINRYLDTDLDKDEKIKRFKSKFSEFPDDLESKVRDEMLNILIENSVAGRQENLKKIDEILSKDLYYEIERMQDGKKMSINVLGEALIKVQERLYAREDNETTD